MIDTTGFEYVFFAVKITGILLAVVGCVGLLGLGITWWQARRSDKRDDFMREQHAYEGEVIGDASTLGRPEATNPFRKKLHEVEPMGM